MIGFQEIMLILVILLLLLGPSKLPSLARSLGEAIREYKKASSELLSPVAEKPTEEELLISTAKKLGIETKGKSTRQIAEAILKEASKTHKKAKKKA
jgi:sec-independent protein translocase protein TatA